MDSPLSIPVTPPPPSTPVSLHATPPPDLVLLNQRLPSPALPEPTYVPVADDASIDGLSVFANPLKSRNRCSPSSSSGSSSLAAPKPVKPVKPAKPVRPRAKAKAKKAKTEVQESDDDVTTITRVDQLRMEAQSRDVSLEKLALYDSISQREPETHMSAMSNTLTELREADQEVQAKPNLGAGRMMCHSAALFCFAGMELVSGQLSATSPHILSGYREHMTKSLGTGEFDELFDELITKYNITRTVGVEVRLMLALGVASSRFVGRGLSNMARAAEEPVPMTTDEELEATRRQMKANRGK